jgi:hypothetical protein
MLASCLFYYICIYIFACMCVHCIVACVKKPKACWSAVSGVVMEGSCALVLRWFVAEDSNKYIH